MVQAGVRKILNDVIDGDSIIDYYNIETVANMYPGAVVKRDTTDFDIEACDASGNATGFLGYGNCVGPFKPDTRETIYDVSGNAPVHSGGGFFVRARCASSSFTKGEELSAAAGGDVESATVGTSQVIGRAAETTSSAEFVWMISYI